MNSRTIRSSLATTLGTLAIFIGVTLCSASTALPVVDVVTEWNQQAVTLTLLPASAQSPVQQTRTMAIVHVSIHDAVNGITRQFATYLSPAEPPAGASAEAAAIAAAHHALRNLFPGSAAALDVAYADSLVLHGISPADPGIAYGQATAAAVIAARANDGASAAQFPYDAPGAGDPGVWERIGTTPALLPGWGDVAPWVMQSGDQFRPEPPPARESELYARDYNEIKDVGAMSSQTRTAEQSQIATFWRASPTAIWNPVIRQIVTARNPDLSSSARTYALVYLAVADASVACWDAKYFYNFWRPQAAIRRGAEDGNDATTADPTWTPFVPTPPHPEYPSGHGTNSSAMASILAALFDDEPGFEIEVTISGITRSWKSLSAGVDEVINARVYSGIHFRNSDEVGVRQGRQVAQFVFTHALRPCVGKGPRRFIDRNGPCGRVF